VACQHPHPPVCTQAISCMHARSRNYTHDFAPVIHTRPLMHTCANMRARHRAHTSVHIRFATEVTSNLTSVFPRVGAARSRCICETGSSRPERRWPKRWSVLESSCASIATLWTALLVSLWCSANHSLHVTCYCVSSSLISHPTPSLPFTPTHICIVLCFTYRFLTLKMPFMCYSSTSAAASPCRCNRVGRLRGPLLHSTAEFSHLCFNLGTMFKDFDAHAKVG